MYSLQRSWYLIAMNPPIALSAFLAQAGYLPRDIPWIAIVALGIYLASPKNEDKTSPKKEDTK